MAVGKFDPIIHYERHDDEFVVKVRGVMTLDATQGEKPMVVCVRVFQDDSLLAECNSADHTPAETFPAAEPGVWKCHGHTDGQRVPAEDKALGMAVLVTGSADAGLNTYTWSSVVQLKEGHPHSKESHPHSN
jgi:hypothetical protein